MLHAATVSPTNKMNICDHDRFTSFLPTVVSKYTSTYARRQPALTVVRIGHLFIKSTIFKCPLAWLFCTFSWNAFTIESAVESSSSPSGSAQ